MPMGSPFDRMHDTIVAGRMAAGGAAGALVRLHESDPILHNTVHPHQKGPLMTEHTLGQRLRHAPDAWHERLDSPGMWRPVLDRVARASARGTLPAVVDRATALRLVPLTRRTVSVVIPCYNYGRFLPEAVGSVLDQVGVDVDVVVVDDCSTDDSAAVAESLAAADPRVRLVRNPRNLGHVATFNAGYEHTEGEFVVRLDADDLLTPGSLGRAVALMEEHPSLSLVYGHPRHFTSAHPPQPWLGRVTWSVWRGEDWLRERSRRGTNCITTPEALLRRDVLEETGPLNENLRFAQDMEMWVRASTVGDVGRVNGADQALHRDHDASMSVNEGSGLLVDLHERRMVFSEVFRTRGPHVRDAKELEDLCRKTLATEALGHVVHLRDRGRDTAEQVEGLLAFATDTCPSARELPAWSRAVGARRSPSVVRVARAITTRARGELSYLRWTRSGV